MNIFEEYKDKIISIIKKAAKDKSQFNLKREFDKTTYVEPSKERWSETAIKCWEHPW